MQHSCKPAPLWAVLYLACVLVCSGLAAGQQLPLGNYTIELAAGRERCQPYAGFLRATDCGMGSGADVWWKDDGSGMQAWSFVAPPGTEVWYDYWNDVMGRNIMLRSLGRSPPYGSCYTSLLQSSSACGSHGLAFMAKPGDSSLWVLESTGTADQYYIRSMGRAGCEKQYLCMAASCASNATDMCTQTQAGAITAWVVTPTKVQYNVPAPVPAPVPATTQAGVAPTSKPPPAPRQLSAPLPRPPYRLPASIPADAGVTLQATAQGSAPGQPFINLVIVLASGQMDVTLTPPTARGDTAITSYRVVGVPRGGGPNITTGGNMGQSASGGKRLFSFRSNSYRPGLEYTLYAFATNAAGEGPASGAYKFSTPARAPGAPTITLILVPSSGDMAVTVAPPDSDGSSAITSYRIVGVPGRAGGPNITAGGDLGTFIPNTGGKRRWIFPAGSYQLAQQYVFYAFARNLINEGPASEGYGFATPLGRPGRPTINIINVAPSREMTVQITMPKVDGGTAITSNRVVGVPVTGGSNITSGGTLGEPVAGGKRVLTFPPGSFEPNVQYVFYAYSNNPSGEGPPSDAFTIVTPPNRPGRPTIDRVSLQEARELAVVVAPPSNDGGADVTSYRVVGRIGGDQQGEDITIEGNLGTPIANSGGRRKFVFPPGSYVDATQYDFVAYAVNAIGEGPASDAVSFATSAAPPPPRPPRPPPPSPPPRPPPPSPCTPVDMPCGGSAYCCAGFSCTLDSLFQSVCAAVPDAPQDIYLGTLGQNVDVIVLKPPNTGGKNMAVTSYRVWGSPVLGGTNFTATGLGVPVSISFLPVGSTLFRFTSSNYICNKEYRIFASASNALGESGNRAFGPLNVYRTPDC